MYDEEKNDVTKLSIHVREEIAKTTQLHNSDVADCLQKYKQMQQFHLWLKGKEARKEPIPETREELMH